MNGDEWVGEEQGCEGMGWEVTGRGRIERKGERTQVSTVAKTLTSLHKLQQKVVDFVTKYSKKEHRFIYVMLQKKFLHPI